MDSVDIVFTGEEMVVNDYLTRIKTYGRFDTSRNPVQTPRLSVGAPNVTDIRLRPADDLEVLKRHSKRTIEAQPSFKKEYMKNKRQTCRTFG